MDSPSSGQTIRSRTSNPAVLEVKVTKQYTQEGDFEYKA
jgi:hypothetical protein